MKNNNLRVLSETEKENIYGGFWPLIGMLLTVTLPAAFNAVAQGVSAIKMATADNGSYKTKEFESHWSENKENASNSKDKKENIKQIVYAY